MSVRFGVRCRGWGGAEVRCRSGEGLGIGGGAGGRAGSRGPSPMRLSARSLLEPCCWSTAESPRKSPAASPSVSAAWDEAGYPHPPPGVAPPTSLEAECCVSAASRAGSSRGAW